MQEHFQPLAAGVVFSLLGVCILIILRKLAPALPIGALVCGLALVPVHAQTTPPRVSPATSSSATPSGKRGGEGGKSASVFLSVGGFSVSAWTFPDQTAFTGTHEIWIVRPGTSEMRHVTYQVKSTMPGSNSQVVVIKHGAMNCGSARISIDAAHDGELVVHYGDDVGTYGKSSYAALADQLRYLKYVAGLSKGKHYKGNLVFLPAIVPHCLGTRPPPASGT